MHVVLALRASTIRRLIHLYGFLGATILIFYSIRVHAYDVKCAARLPTE